MSRNGDAVTAHYAEHARQFIDVPEWKVDGKPMRIYWDQLTIAAVEDMQERNIVADLDIVLDRAKDKQGKRMFDIDDKVRMKTGADALIVRRVATAMLGSPRVTAKQIEEAEKN